jgi:chromosome segregation ATPase
VKPARKDAAAAATEEASAHNEDDQYLLGIGRLMLPLKLEPPSPSTRYETDAAELEQLAGGLKNLTGQLASITQQFSEASGKIIKTRAALRLLEARHPVRLEAFGLIDGTLETVRAVEAEAVSTRDSLRHSVHEVVAALNRRLQLALSIKLADESETETAGRIHELVADLNQARDEFAEKQELLETIAGCVAEK